MRVAFVALATLVLAACGGKHDDQGSPRSSTGAPATELLAQAERRLRGQASFSFTAESVRTRADRPDDPERYATTEGAVDLEAGTGNVVLQLDLGAPFETDGPYEVRWTPDVVVAELHGEKRRMTRRHARRFGGLIGRLPDEPPALVELLGEAQTARVVGEEEVDGERLTRIAFSVDMRAAGRAGVPAEIAFGAAAGTFGRRLPLEAWLDAGGLPRRIAYEIRQAEQRGDDGKILLPRRTVRVTYELHGFGR